MPDIKPHSQQVVSREKYGDVRVTTISAETEDGKTVYRDSVTDYSKTGGQWSLTEWRDEA